MFFTSLLNYLTTLATYKDQLQDWIVRLNISCFLSCCPVKDFSETFHCYKTLGLASLAFLLGRMMDDCWGMLGWQIRMIWSPERWSAESGHVYRLASDVMTPGKNSHIVTWGRLLQWSHGGQDSHRIVIHTLGTVASTLYNWQHCVQYTIVTILLLFMVSYSDNNKCLVIRLYNIINYLAIEL